MVEIEETAAQVHDGLLPEKSRDLYMAIYQNFIKWKKSQGFVEINEDVILRFLSVLAKTFSPISVVAKYTMLKKSLLIYHNIDSSRYRAVKTFLKRNKDGYVPKKSKTFTEEDIGRFMTEAPDQDYLGVKAVAIMAISGMLSREEIYKVRTSDLSFKDSSLFVKILKSRTKISSKFAITGTFFEKFKKYYDLRPKDYVSDKVFINYQQGKCYRKRMGAHTIGHAPKEIATFLNLESPELYTGHAFKRSSATIIVNSAGGLMHLKRSERWQSTTMAEKIENAIMKKSRVESPDTTGAHVQDLPSNFFEKIWYNLTPNRELVINQNLINFGKMNTTSTTSVVGTISSERSNNEPFFVNSCNNVHINFMYQK